MEGVIVARPAGRSFVAVGREWSDKARPDEGGDDFVGDVGDVPGEILNYTELE
jgi:hypothetical protein